MVSTADSDSVCLGSNPRSPAKQRATRKSGFFVAWLGGLSSNQLQNRLTILDWVRSFVLRCSLLARISRGQKPRLWRESQLGFFRFLYALYGEIGFLFWLGICLRISSVFGKPNADWVRKCDKSHRGACSPGACRNSLLAAMHPRSPAKLNLI